MEWIWNIGKLKAERIVAENGEGKDIIFFFHCRFTKPPCAMTNYTSTSASMQIGKSWRLLKIFIFIVKSTYSTHSFAPLNHNLKLYKTSFLSYTSSLCVWKCMCMGERERERDRECERMSLWACERNSLWFL